MAILDHPDRWVVAWSGGGLTARKVELVNPTTGQRATGRDWKEWDDALEQALHKAENEGDLVSEVESFLQS